MQHTGRRGATQSRTHEGEAEDGDIDGAVLEGEVCDVARGNVGVLGHEVK